MTTYAESKNLIPHENIKQHLQSKPASYIQDNRSHSILQKKQVEALQSKPEAASPIQKKANQTGLPEQLKSGIESLSGHSMNDVKVHYNSSKPAQLNAHAYAQGTDIHVASGQEKHLPHEAWHVAQQKQGRVKPTKQMKGKVNINDDKGLEKEADVMGGKALQIKNKQKPIKQAIQNLPKISQFVKIKLDEGSRAFIKEVHDSKLIISCFSGIDIAGYPKTQSGRQRFLNNCLDDGEIEDTVLEALRKNFQAASDEAGASAESLEESLDERGKKAFEYARAKLGEPINDPVWASKKREAQQGESRGIAEVGKLHEELKKLMGIKDEDIKAPEEEVRLEWMLKSAALGSAIGAGVCNNFGSLTALILKFLGIKNVQLMGTDTHNWARYSKPEGRQSIEVDPWKEEHYAPKADIRDQNVTLDLSKFSIKFLWDGYTHYTSEALRMRNEIIGKHEETFGKLDEYRDGPFMGRAWLKFSVRKDGEVLLSHHGLFFLAPFEQGLREMD